MTTGRRGRRLGPRSGHKATRCREDPIKQVRKVFLLFNGEKVKMSRLGARNGWVGSEFTGDFLFSSEVNEIMVAGGVYKDHIWLHASQSLQG